jgi:hypothetical protein
MVTKHMTMRAIRAPCPTLSVLVLVLIERLGAMTVSMSRTRRIMWQHVSQEDFMKAVRKLNEAKKLEGTLDSTFGEK